MELEIKLILANQLGIEATSISNAQSIIHDLGADSIDVVEVIMSLEKKFRIIIETNEVDENVTVQFLLDLVAQKLSETIRPKITPVL
jgi:acyl carrier protein